MSYINALYKTYDYCLENSLVDIHEDGKTVILPLYHTSYKSGGRDVIKIQIDIDGKFKNAMYLDKGETIIFPVTEDSLTRTSGPVSHPLVDQFSYIYYGAEERKKGLYIEELKKWIEFSDENGGNDYLSAIYSYVISSDIADDILKSIYRGTDAKLSENHDVEYIDRSGKKEVKKQDSLLKQFITFEIVDYDDLNNVSVTENKRLHKDYIEYVESQNKLKELKTCIYSNEEQYCALKHRGMIGNSKLISVSSKEAYFGRFQSGEEVMNIGHRTSQKIHNMLKFFYDNSNSRKWIGGSQYLMNWFSSDISNDRGIDISTQISPRTKASEDDEELAWDDYGNLGNNIYDIVNNENKGLFEYIYGESDTDKKIDSNDNYYVIIIDKINDGRVAVKYFREMPESDLKERLIHWHRTCSWQREDFKTGNKIEVAPSIFTIVDSCFGIERDGKLILDNDKFRSQQIQKLLPCLIENQRIPMNLVKKMFVNTCDRQRYDKTWNRLLFTACALIKKYYIDYKNEEVGYMLDLESNDRSYLFGRLLAAIEGMENATFEKNENRTTNAQRLWSVYTQKPAHTMNRLMEKLAPYKNKLSTKKPKLYVMYENIISDIMINIGELSRNGMDDKQLNKALDYKFVLGYYAQKKDLYTKKEKEESNKNHDDEQTI